MISSAWRWGEITVRCLTRSPHGPVSALAIAIQERACGHIFVVVVLAAVCTVSEIAQRAFGAFLIELPSVADVACAQQVNYLRDARKDCADDRSLQSWLPPLAKQCGDAPALAGRPVHRYRRWSRSCSRIIAGEHGFLKLEAQGEEVMSDHPAKKRKARRKGLPPPQVELEFRNTDQAIARTADRIKGEIEKLFSRLPLKYVAWDYVVERLIDELITDNPELLDWLNGIKSPRGDISMRLAEALADWRDSQVHER